MCVENSVDIITFNMQIHKNCMLTISSGSAIHGSDSSEWMPCSKSTSPKFDTTNVCRLRSRKNGNNYGRHQPPACEHLGRPHSALRERVSDMAIEQFVAPHCGVRTNHSAVFSHMIPEVCD